SAVEETATGEPTGQPPGAGGIGSDPIRPSERRDYETEPAGDESSVTAPPSSPPWIAIGLALLAIFIAILLWAVLVGGRAAT
ncbi:MAG TPA: hypothetical protein VGK63_10135, partial [Candidatus Limnocylindrales bacterium]